jgi:hypothetical protein
MTVIVRILLYLPAIFKMFAFFLLILPCMHALLAFSQSTLLPALN